MVQVKKGLAGAGPRVWQGGLGFGRATPTWHEPRAALARNGNLPSPKFCTMQLQALFILPTLSTLPFDPTPFLLPQNAHSVHSVHPVHTVHTAHSIHTVHTVRSVHTNRIPRISAAYPIYRPHLAHVRLGQPWAAVAQRRVQLNNERVEDTRKANKAARSAVDGVLRVQFSGRARVRIGEEEVECLGCEEKVKVGCAVPGVVGLLVTVPSVTACR